MYIIHTSYIGRLSLLHTSSEVLMEFRTWDLIPHVVVIFVAVVDVFMLLLFLLLWLFLLLLLLIHVADWN